MKNIFSLTALCTVAVAAFTSGCAYRSPEMWRDDSNKVLVTKNEEIRICYDGVLKTQPGVGGKVTVKFEVETEAGKIQNVTIDQANTTAPPAVSDCVKHSIEGLVITPPDARVGQGTYTYEFAQPKA